MRFIRPGEREIPLKIKGHGIEEYSVTVGVPQVSMGPIEAPAHVMRAARELRRYIALVTGVSLPVTTDRNPLVKECEIVVGRTCRRAAAEYAAEEYEIRTEGARLFIEGGKRGLLYGVYVFLEKFLGFRFFAENVERILYAESIEIGDICERYAPPLEYRELCYWTAFDTEFAVKSKINGKFIREIPEEWGGGIGWAGGAKGLVHTFAHLVPYSKYFRRHPEMFALGEDGRRDPSGLCLSCEDTFRAALKTAKEWLREAGEEDILSVSPNDGKVAWCHCAACEQVRREEDGESGNVLRFVNRMARELKKVRGNVVVDTIAYGKVTETPLVTRPEKNVLVRVCGNLTRSHSYADYGKDPLIENDAAFSLFARKLESWRKVCGKIYVWDYPAPYNVINSVFPQFHTFVRNARYFLEHGVRGVYINGNTETAQFTALTVYLIAKLAYEPQMSEEEFERHMNEFLAGYYGRGWRHIRAFIDFTEELARGRVFTSHTEPPQMFAGEYPNAALCEKLCGYFADAAKEAETDGERYRIGKDALQAEYYALYDLPPAVRAAMTPQELGAYEERCRRLYEELKRYGILRVVENTFLPVVNDFSQPPKHWGFWDGACTVGDRNNENYARDIFAMIPCDLPAGTRVDVDFLLCTNNTEEGCTAQIFAGGGYVPACEEGTAVPAVWKNYQNYRRVKAQNAVVTDLKHLAAFENRRMDDGAFRFIYPHLKGLLFKMNGIGAGAYFFIKDVHIAKR